MAGLRGSTPSWPMGTYPPPLCSKPNGYLADGPLFLIYVCLINMQMCSKPRVIKCCLHLLACFKSINSNINKNIVIFSAQKGSVREWSWCIHSAVCSRSVPLSVLPPFPVSHSLPPYELGPAQGFPLINVSFSLPRLLVRGPGSGFLWSTCRQSRLLKIPYNVENRTEKWKDSSRPTRTPSVLEKSH